MIKIAHRGNFNGPDQSTENSPEQVYKAILAGYNAEVDLWVVDQKLYFGHDKPTYLVDPYFIHQNVTKLWLHCKNLEALDFTLSMPKYYQSFWHQEDDFAITSNNYIWTYPGKLVNNKSILVCKDIPSKEILSSNIAGICTPYVGILSLIKLDNQNVY